MQVLKILVGNKSDLYQYRQVAKEAGVFYAKRHGMMFMETSAKTAEGIKLLFQEMVEATYENVKPRRIFGDIRPKLITSKSRNKKCC